MRKKHFPFQLFLVPFHLLCTGLQFKMPFQTLDCCWSHKSCFFQTSWIYRRLESALLHFFQFLQRPRFVLIINFFLLNETENLHWMSKSRENYTQNISSSKMETMYLALSTQSKNLLVKVDIITQKRFSLKLWLQGGYNHSEEIQSKTLIVKVDIIIWKAVKTKKLACVELHTLNVNFFLKTSVM